jgi:hypothetical protein
MDEEQSIRPAVVSSAFVLMKCNYFVDVQLWPILSRVNPELWLTNFRENELEHAVQLLNGFLYYSNVLVEELFKSAFQRLSTKIGCLQKPYAQALAHWDSFRRNLIVTYVTGETPSETDSGFIFARMARQALGISEKQIMSPLHVLETLMAEGPRPVVFVDDFVGSGNQCADTWGREVNVANGTTSSFAKYSATTGGAFYYCPIVCTDLGRQVIGDRCPGLQLWPAHYLSTRYSAISSDSLIWPERLWPSALDFLMSVSKRAGIPDDQWAGFNDLALTLAFEHCVPDATLPIFYSERNGWHPLVRRT